MLEIGTGTGVGTCWLLDGMDATARLTTVDIDPKVQAIARTHLGTDPRLTILSEDAAVTIRREAPSSFDLIFADGGAGKHTLLNEALALLRPGGIYICDDTKPHPMWPPEHAVKIPHAHGGTGREAGFSPSLHRLVKRRCGHGED